ncbi:hypothetical protein D9757_011464 [Collybiopsis confluens]|uniref:Uncharacterized protein n=1 Tax=Collybiopsis confluens TaxID=2823264 RepID=A0A8H5GJW1_9AGAR|nr:hypothetical protein D9757_011464 [Collybiopsis confluens]
MSISSLLRSRPLDPLLLEDGLASGSSSFLSSAPVLGLGQTPESAVVNEIFNNPDAWSVQVPVHEEGNGLAVSVGTGITSGDSMSGSRQSGSSGDAVHASGSSSSKKLKSSMSARHTEGYHLKRKSKLHVEAFTLRPFESRHLVIPYLTSASSISDSSSLSSSITATTPSLNSSLPTISDEDSVGSHAKSLRLSRIPRWRGMRDTNNDYDHDEKNRATDSFSLMELMEPSNALSPEAGERMSILWSHQNIFRAFPTPNGTDFTLGSSVPDSSKSSAGRVAVNSALPLSLSHNMVERRKSVQTTVMKPRRNVPSLTISTTTTRTTKTRRTTVFVVQSPEKSSPATSIAIVSASATWSILDLYGDSPKHTATATASPSPKAVILPKTSGHLHSSFKSSDLQLPPLPALPRLTAPKSAFVSRFTDSTGHTGSGSAKIVELPADFVIPTTTTATNSRPPLLRAKSAKVRGPRKVPHSPLPMPKSIILPKGDDVPPPLPEKDGVAVMMKTKDRDRKSKVRPLPKVPLRLQSPPPPLPVLQIPAVSFPAPTTKTKTKTMESTFAARKPLEKSGSSSSSSSTSTTSITTAVSSLSSSTSTSASTTPPSISVASLVQKVNKSALRSRMPPPPPLSLNSPLPPLPFDTVDALPLIAVTESNAQPQPMEPKAKAQERLALYEMNVKNKALKVTNTDAVKKEKEAPVKIVPIAPVVPKDQQPPTRPDRTPGDSIVSLSPPVLPMMPPPIILPLAPPPSLPTARARAPPAHSQLAPARPSRKDVSSPLPSPNSDRMKALESLPLHTVLSPPSPIKHKPSASESSIRRPEYALDEFGFGPEFGQGKKLSAKKSIRKSSSFSSLPRFLMPDVPLPDASVLAQRSRGRKNSVPSGAVRPPIEEGFLRRTPAPLLRKYEDGYGDLPEKTTSLRGTDDGSDGIGKSESGGGGGSDGGDESVPSASPSMKDLVSNTLQLELDLAPKEPVLKGSSVPIKKANEIEFPTIEMEQPIPPVPALSRVSEGYRAPPSPILAHRKGTSLQHTESRPILKTHKKSSSSLSFRPPFVEPPLPDAGVLAKRLIGRKDSISSGTGSGAGSGFRPPFAESASRKNSITRDSRPPFLSQESRKDSITKDTRPYISTTASDTAIPSRNPPPEGRPVVLHSTSDMVIPYRPPVTWTSSSSSSSPLRTPASTYSSPSHSRNSSTTSSPAPIIMRRRNGSISVRRPMVDNVPIPDSSVLAQRTRNMASPNTRALNDTIDAFAPSASSAFHSSSSSGNRSDSFSSTGSAGGTPVNVTPLPAPQPVVASGSWVPQIFSRLADPEASRTILSEPEIGRSLHSRAGSGTAQVTEQDTTPVVHSHSHSRSNSSTTPSLSRDSPALQVPPNLETVSRALSPGILIRNKAASPVPQSKMHVRFRSIDKHPVPPLVLPSASSVKNSALATEPATPAVTTMGNSNSNSNSSSGSSTRGRPHQRPPPPPLERAETTVVRGRQTSAVPKTPSSSSSSSNRSTASSQRSASVAPVSRHATSGKRSASVTSSHRNRVPVPAASSTPAPALPQPPPLPVGSMDGAMSPSMDNAGSIRGRISPFPSRPVSRVSLYSARVGA